MIPIRVTYSDGNTTDTMLNGTIDDARAYYIGQWFNFGDTDECPRDQMVQAVAVEVLS